MSRRLVLLTVMLLILTSLAQPAMAVWKTSGSYEPDTDHDVNDGFMWTEPDTNDHTTVGKVYFNAVAHFASVGVNPNNGVTESQLYPGGFQGWFAYLGIWKDCNHDGYVGTAQGALLEYRSELLLASSICPGNTRFNRDGWVHEFLWIGPTDVVGDQNLDGDVRDDAALYAPRAHHDQGALVWGDYGLPGAGDDICPLIPPGGTSASTGGLLAYTDCYTNRRLASNVNFLESDVTGKRGLGFEDPAKPQESKSLLNQDLPRSLYGNPYNGEGSGTYEGGLLEDGGKRGGADTNPAFTAYDCSVTLITVRDPTAPGGDDGMLSNLPRDMTGMAREPLRASGVPLYDHQGEATLDPTPNDDGTYYRMGNVNPKAGDFTGGSYYDALNNTHEGAIDGCQTGEEHDAPFADVNPEEGFFHDARRSTDVYFAFRGNPRGPLKSSPSIPYDAGLGAARTSSRELGGGMGWVGYPNTLTDPQLVRDNAAPQGAAYASFYAKLGSTSDLQLPGSGVGTYGAEACASGIGEGFRPQSGWNCDPTRWWQNDAQGNPTMPYQPYGPQKPYDAYSPPTSPYALTPRAIGVSVGQTYHLRDIDCFDGELVHGTDAFLSLQYLTDDANCKGTPGAFNEYYDVVPELDEDSNGLGDDYQRRYRLTRTQIEEALNTATDWDTDDAGLLQEFHWDTHPLALPPLGISIEKAQDWDNDNWKDGEEITYWDTDQSPLVEEGLAFRDPDSFTDTNGNRAPNQHDPDSDNDGLRDGDEYKTIGSYPEYDDSDCENTILAECTRPTQTKYGAENRQGKPGTGDGWPDGQEAAYWSAHSESGGPAGDACDGDGIPNILDPDSDNDGLLDGQEHALGLDPCKADEDGDGLKEGEEMALGTDPKDPDTDGDSMWDGWEHAHRPATNPKDATDAGKDFDMDGLANLREWEVQTGPLKDDTDKDTLKDGPEVALGTNPRWWDTDGDGMPDGWEKSMGLNPTYSADASEDRDGDSYVDEETGATYTHTNLEEYRYGKPATWRESVDGPWTLGTNATNPDTDSDGAEDGPEVVHETDPRSPIPTVTTDRDGDGLAAEQELRAGTSPGYHDTDEDGLCDGGRGVSCYGRIGAGTGESGEVLDYGSNPRKTDSDDDGLTDMEEAHLFDPAGSGQTPDTDADGAPAIIDPDADGDGLTDGDEERAIELGGYDTSALLADTDGDTVSDYDELFVRRDNEYAPDPRDLDSDDDGLDDGTELLTYYTHPNRNDTDYDGLRDEREVALQTNPLLADTDRDGMPDGWEVEYVLDPLVDDASDDKDHDSIILGLTNLEEYLHDTDPTKADTDDDGINDYLEVLLGLDPRKATDATSHDDHDGLTNLMEATLGTLPNDADTDDDGLHDGIEACTTDLFQLALKLTCTDPLRRDTDADGLDDARERAAWLAFGPDAWQTDYDSDSMLAPPNGGHNLRDPDSDNDGLDDGQEFLVFRTDGSRPDTDADGETDAYELFVGWTDPRNATSRGGPHPPNPTTDKDLDGVSDAQERDVYGTDPNKMDTDADGLPDGYERILWGNEWNNDIDNDGVGNLFDSDSDADGLMDGIEFIVAPLARSVFMIGDPRDNDTDNDGLADGAEASNNLRLPAAAQTNPTQPTSPASAPWSGVDAAGYYVTGLFGLRLYNTLTPQANNAPSAGRPSTDSSPSGSTYDFADSDEDLLNDGSEQQRGCNPNGDDTDADGILDWKEPAGDADQDGHPNCDDTDSDNDDILDRDEDNDGDGKRAKTETSAYDADTDDDARCDADETAAGSLTSPINPDTDEDGLSDGREYFLRGKCALIDSPVTTWTSETTRLTATVNGRLIDTWRLTYQPYAGPAEAPTVNALGQYPSRVSDWDMDGIIDGIEDWDLDGVLDEGETNWQLDDSDGDRLKDGLELLINGPMTLAQFIQIGHAGDISKAHAAAKYDATNWRKTDPLAKDTDDDKISDTEDINPNGLAPALFEVILRNLTVIDPIDVDVVESRCSPELYAIIDIKTAAGNITIETPAVDVRAGLGCREELPLPSVLPTAKMADSKIRGLLTGRESVGDALVRLNLIENILSYQPNADTDALATQEIIVKIKIGDEDNGRRDENDVMDIHPKTGKKVYELRFMLGTNGVVSGQPTPSVRQPRDANGELDPGASMFHENDASLTLSLVDNVRKTFLDTTIKLRDGPEILKVGPPDGQQWG